MTLSVLQFGDQYGLYDADVKGFIHGPAPQHECFDCKHRIENTERLQADQVFKRRLTTRYIQQLVQSGLSSKAAVEKLRQLMPQLFQDSAIDSTGKLF